MNMEHEGVNCDNFNNIPHEVRNYKFIRSIGRGPNSIVKLATDIDTDDQYAIKIMHVGELIEKGLYDTAIAEIKMNQKFDSPHILKVFDHFQEGDFYYVVTEYCKNGTLFQYISDKGSFSENDCRNIFRGIVESIAYLHSKNFSHRGLVLDAFLLDEKNEIKLTNFRTVHQTIQHQLLVSQCGSPLFAPPEVIRNLPYEGEKVDVWALGVILYTMFTGTMPFVDKNPSKLLAKIVMGEYTIPQTAPPLLQDLLTTLMSVEPERRPSSWDILRHPWFLMLEKPAQANPNHLRNSEKTKFSQTGPSPIRMNRSCTSSSLKHNQISSTAKIFLPRKKNSQRDLSISSSREILTRRRSISHIQKKNIPV